MEKPEQKKRGYTVGVQTGDLKSLIERVKLGIPFKALEKLQRKSGLNMSDVGRVIKISPSAMSRRKESGKLKPEESERLMRLVFLYEQTLDLFEGNESGARDWLEKSNPALGGDSPLEMAETEFGAREVERLIGRLEHGVF